MREATFFKNNCNFLKQSNLHGTELNHGKSSILTLKRILLKNIDHPKSYENCVEKIQDQEYLKQNAKPSQF